MIISLKLLKNADINISDYKLEISEDSAPQFRFPPGIKIDEKVFENIKGKSYSLTTFHKVSLGKEEKSYALPFDFESKGTRLLFSYVPVILNALKPGKTIIIDEIDSGIHPVLVQYLIELFQNPESNPNHAQLIFNTHNVSLLNLDLFRRICSAQAREYPEKVFTRKIWRYSLCWIGGNQMVNKVKQKKRGKIKRKENQLILLIVEGDTEKNTSFLSILI